MEDVVAIVGTDSKKRSVAFMTWGRLYDRVDESELISVVAAQSKNFAGAPMKNLRLCGSLRDVSQYEYFFEALFYFCWRPIPFGTKIYSRWRTAARKRLESGKDLLFLGSLAKTKRM
jgi:hypothetical protein